jgi:hypothetical protein
VFEIISFPLKKGSLGFKVKESYSAAGKESISIGYFLGSMYLEYLCPLTNVLQLSNGHS